MQISVIFDVINKATKPLRDIDANFKGITKTMNTVQGCMWKFNQTSELFQRMGQTITQLSQPFRDFEQGMADLSALTGLVGEDLERLGKVARKTGVDSGLGATGALEAFKLLASQIQVDDIGLDGLIQLQKETITLSQAAGSTVCVELGSDGQVWMSRWQLTDLFGVYIQTITANVKVIIKSGAVKPSFNCEVVM